MQLRLSLNAAVFALAVLMPVAAPLALAQTAGSAAPQGPVPQGPIPQAGPAKKSANSPIGTLNVTPSGDAANPFPKPDPKNFTADTPTAETVNAFLQLSWGYDPQRIWQVQAILKTPAPGVSKVVVLVTQKGLKQDGKPQVATLQFFTLPDGKHIIADDVLPFGATPFAENRAILQQRANGSAIGAASKDLMLVEFADFQCPHCKEVQATMEKLRQQFPNARFIYENYPLVQIHPDSYKAASYSVCVAKIGGNDAFFKYATAVYDAQASLTPEGSDQALKDAATKVGLDPAKVAACSTSADAKSAVDASIKLAQDLNINQTPTLAVNGRLLPLANLPVEALIQLISFQAASDGVQAATK
jgi:protein-disulfide isomerase